MKKIKKNRELIIVHNQSYKDKRGYFKEILLEKNIKKKFPFLVMSYSKKCFKRFTFTNEKISR